MGKLRLLLYMCTIFFVCPAGKKHYKFSSDNLNKMPTTRICKPPPIRTIMPGMIRNDENTATKNDGNFVLHCCFIEFRRHGSTLTLLATSERRSACDSANFFFYQFLKYEKTTQKVYYVVVIRGCNILYSVGF